MDNSVTVCVYCASSSKCNKQFLESAYLLGQLLAINGFRIVYGGGSAGLMGQLADGGLSVGGSVSGIIPGFMQELEWGHKGLSELRQVNSMHERKLAMMIESQAIVALPGGCGTMEELLEAITWKRLGLITSAIVIVNELGYYDPLLTMLDKSIDEQFMRSEHRGIWTVVESVDEVPNAINNATEWHASPQSIAQA